MSHEISEGRKVAYYLGIALIVGGLLLFVSVFFTNSSPSVVLDPAGFGERRDSSMTRAFLGMALMVVGSLLRVVGARGLAGSGVVLDPKRARQDLEPWSRQVGGMAKDALDEAGVELGGGDKVVMLKCRACSKLNEEDSKFCQHCGQPI
ncbi:MAG: zinc ribbon domain-containing protein [Planctomycetes bacterium]|nr:zinc ribbon domain-containing protein [Planctomycetota bacterium]